MTRVVAAFWLIFAVVGILPSRAIAADVPTMRVSVSNDTVGVGSMFRVTANVESSDEAPEAPSLGNIRGFELRGTSASPSQMTTIINGVRTDRRGLNVVWTLQAERVGTFRIGPPVVTVGGKRYAGQTISVTVVPAGKAPSSPAPPTVNRFDPFAGLFPHIDDDVFGSNEPQFQLNPQLALERPRGQVVFLHALADKTSAVVGEQVTVSVLLYADVTAGQIPIGDVHEAAATEFIKRPLIADDAATVIGNTRIGDRIYTVRLIRKWALFPLKTGDLEVGSMSLSIGNRGGAPAVRESERLRVHVTEPPPLGRPAGYASGDVGRFDLSSKVAPRDVQQGGVLSVTIELSGVGNLPGAITPPARAGVEWLEPQIRDKVGIVEGDKFGGRRTFEYVVRMKAAGEIDLGAIVIPYWSPDLRRYGIARTDLGRVLVKPNAAADEAAANDKKAEIFTDLPPAKASLIGAKRAPRGLVNTPLYWFGLVAAPALYLLTMLALAIARAVRRRRAARAESPEQAFAQRIRDAETQAKSADARGIDGATLRALRAATVQAKDVESAVKEQVQRLIEECDSARFSPELIDPEQARVRWRQARKLIDAMKVKR